jgi:hypothetical protein
VKVANVFLYFFILTSFITRTSGEAGVGIMGRITVADIFAVISIFLFLFYAFSPKVNLKFPFILKIFYFLILTFFLGIFTSLNTTGTIMELIILLFLSIIFIVLINTHKSEKKFLNLLIVIASTSFLASFIGIWDVMSVGLGLPRFFPRDPEMYNLAVSGFRNTGQAGAYILIMLAIIISLIASPLYKLYSKKQQLFFKISLIISILFLFLTVKIAAYIGFFVGIFLFALKKRNMAVVYSLSFFGLILFVLFINLQEIAPSLYGWMTFKVEDRLSGGGGGGGFIAHNLGSALMAFSDNPLFGSAIGGFAHSIYGKFEVHSTYFKMIGETGIIGTIGYIVFMYFMFKMVFYNKKLYKHNPYAEFLSNIQPFFYGFIISWGYTYHLRKREFWILVAVIYLANVFMKKYQTKKRKKIDFNKTKSI